VGLAQFEGVLATHRLPHDQTSATHSLLGLLVFEVLKLVLVCGGGGAQQLQLGGAKSIL